MATTPQVKSSQTQAIEEAASNMARILEEHFDEMGWSDEERNQRVARAAARIDAVVTRAKSSKSS
jgi:hypothetical protein